MQNNTQQKDYSQMTKDELEREVLELRRQIENHRRIVDEKNKFIKAKMLETYPELKPEIEELDLEGLEEETFDTRKEEKKEIPPVNYNPGMRTIKRVAPIQQAPKAPIIESRGAIPEKKNEPGVDLNKPVKSESNFSDNTKREIEELKRKLQTLERKEEYTKTEAPKVVERRSEFSPVLKVPTQEEKPQKASTEPNPPKFSESENLGGQRYGVEPAKDLEAGDFDWKGNIGGVEIEKSDEESEEKEELEKAKILEEIEHPPAYTRTAAVENKSGQFQNRVGQTAPKPQEEKSNPEAELSREELEKVRQIRYKGEDPYREPVE